MKSKVKLWLIIILMFTVWSILIYSISNKIQIERENIKKDEYNFSELEKVKSVLENIPKDADKFYTLKDFNKKYIANTKPLNDCFYVSNSNWGERYIFWFKLYSNKYKDKYWIDYYAYPRYDLPAQYFCWWSDNCTDDIVYNNFRKIINYPCEE